VLAGLLWTGIDLFMGFVLGPIIRQLDLAARRALITRLMPRTIFLMPTLATITGFLALSYPGKAWVVASLVIIAFLSLQGLGFLLPINVRICLELQKDQPDLARIGRWTRSYLRVTALQGAMQVAMIAIMARFATGL
jgi:hypothetical protein